MKQSHRAAVTDAQRIDAMVAETELRTIEIMIEYAQLSDRALDRLNEAIACIRQALKDYRGTLQ